MGTAEELEQRLDAGAELTIGEVAALTGLSRSTIHRQLRAGALRYRRTPGGYRGCHPEDVRRLLDERRQLYRDAEDSPPPDADGSPESQG